MSEQMDDEISLSDIFNFYMENWVVLTALPLVVAAAAFLIVTMQPQTYQASTTLSPPAEGAELTSGLYSDALDIAPPVNFTMERGNIRLSAAQPERESARRAVQSALAGLLATTGDAVQEERARLDRQRRILDQIWQNVGNSQQAVFNASSLEGDLTERSDRVALVERWLVGAKTSQVSVNGPTPNPIHYAFGTFFITLLLAGLACLARRAMRAKNVA